MKNKGTNNMAYTRQACVTPEANSYYLATAKSSAFPNEEEAYRLEEHMKEYRAKREKEIQERIISVKKRVSPLVGRKGFKHEGKAIISFA